MTQPTPPPNDLWQYTPPAESKDGRTVRVDAMQLPMVLDLYRVLGVDPNVKPNPRQRR